jgi:gamma-glutamyl-gamma-aminobutyraldehyde dehydrogenase
VLVHESVADEFIATVAAEAPKYQPGDPLSGAAPMGALVDDGQLRTVLGYIDAGHTDGARLVAGGRQARAETGGYFVEPTVFDGVTNQMKIAREEIFGPVMSVIRFNTEAEAIAIATDSPYGLPASVWSRRARSSGGSGKRRAAVPSNQPTWPAWIERTLQSTRP